ncbi:MAG: hypothetical protein KDA62_20375, partial [Planctomycetales bacterium]|nr:hypothetical protein [Planctomycetales bacterium]
MSIRRFLSSSLRKSKQRKQERKQRHRSSFTRWLGHEHLEDRRLLAVDLAPGDLAVVGYNSDTNDFVLVALAEIPASSTIFLTDRGWDGSNLLAANAIETVTTWTTGASAIAAGSLVRISRDEPAFIGNNFGTLSGAGALDHANGDQVLIYQTVDNDSESAPSFVYAFNANDATKFCGIDTSPADGWQDSGATISASTSKLPQGLTAPTTANGLGTAATEFDDFVYNGPTTSADQATWLTRIATSGNWQATDGGVGTGGFDFSAAVGSLPAPGGTLTVSGASVRAVTNTNDSGTGSFRQALIDAQADGDDLIVFDSGLAGGTITVLSDLFASAPNLGNGADNDNSLTIMGLTDANGKPNITINGNGFRGMIYGQSATTGKLTLKDLIWTNFDNDAPAVHAFSSSIEIDNNHFLNNNPVTPNSFSVFGGALVIGNVTADTTATVSNSVFAGNHADTQNL